jgi:hypothetical protein
MNIATAIAIADADEFDPTTAITNQDGTFQGPLFESVEHTFYTSGVLSGSATYAADGDGLRNFPLGSSAYIINIPQRIFGERIRRGTFAFDTPSAGSGTIIDNARGRLIVSTSAGTGSVTIGNVFYNLGIAVVNRLESAGAGSQLIQDDGLYFPSGSTGRTIFSATQTIYEHQVIATIEPYEFNFPTNPTSFGTISTGSLLESGSARVADVILSGTLSPYITTIGLYNDRHQLVAVAKLPRPIKRLNSTQQSFVIRFDL